jgi:predicted AAA+ superfamily ATPase
MNVLEARSSAADYCGFLSGARHFHGQIILVPPYFENLGKRLIKSLKVHLVDSGLACYRLGLTSAAELERSPFLGSRFEGFATAEVIKSQPDRGMRKGSTISAISRVWN